MPRHSQSGVNTGVRVRRPDFRMSGRLDPSIEHPLTRISTGRGPEAAHGSCADIGRATFLDVPSRACDYHINATIKPTAAAATGGNPSVRRGGGPAHSASTPHASPSPTRSCRRAFFRAFAAAAFAFFASSFATWIKSISGWSDTQPHSLHRRCKRASGQGQDGK